MRVRLHFRDSEDLVEADSNQLLADFDNRRASAGAPTVRVGDVTRPWWSLPTIPDYDRPATETEEI